MHGIIFLAMEDFLESRCGAGAWSRAMREANLVEQPFTPDRFYPDEGAIDLFAAVARIVQLPLTETLQQLGHHMSAGLLSMGRSMGLIQEEWRTLDILERLSTEILTAFANHSTGVIPPDIRTYRLKYGEVAVAYLSGRKLCPLFKGIVLGMGAFFNEPIRIEERLCLLENAPLCRLSVYLDDPALTKHINIVREFQMVHSRILEIRFFNTFSGIPVVNKGLVLKYSPDSVLVQICSESLAAMAEEGVTYLALPHLPQGLRAVVAAVDQTQGTALLQEFVPTDGAMGRRLVPRVIPNQPVAIELRINRQTVRGWIANLSEGGLCIILPRSPLLDETLLFAPIQVRFSLPAQKVDTAVHDAPTTKTVLAGNLLHMDEQEERHRLRIVFKPLTVNDAHLLRTYYHEREQIAYRRLSALVASIKK
ncbi:MAG: heme NO-binding domain-containing protein [Magnetococcales bacterium]|nr:heme NO-binding domain-containing protein [Magnetococcales bacterium]